MNLNIGNKFSTKVVFIWFFLLFFDIAQLNCPHVSKLLIVSDELGSLKLYVVSSIDSLFYLICYSFLLNRQ